MTHVLHGRKFFTTILRSLILMVECVEYYHKPQKSILLSINRLYLRKLQNQSKEIIRSTLAETIFWKYMSIYFIWDLSHLWVRLCFAHIHPIDHLEFCGEKNSIESFLTSWADHTRKKSWCYYKKLKILRFEQFLRPKKRNITKSWQRYWILLNTFFVQFFK